MEKISKHVSYKEGIKSNTAMRLNIDNSPGEYHLGNMNAVALALGWSPYDVNIDEFKKEESRIKTRGLKERSVKRKLKKRKIK